ALCADPSPLDFRQGSVGTPVDQQLSLSACGSVPVTLQQVAFDVLSPATFTSTELPGPQTLQPGQKISFHLRFTPEDGSDQNGALKIPNDGQPDQYVPMHGSATYPPTCRLEAGASSVDFGQVVRGQSSQRDVTVANRGLADCSLSAVKISSGTAYFAVVTPPTSAVKMRPGDAFTATVQYLPPGSDTNSSDSGALEFDSDDPLRPQLSRQLAGVPVANPACKGSVTPQPSGFGGVRGRVLH